MRATICFRKIGRRLEGRARARLGAVLHGRQLPCGGRPRSPDRRARDLQRTQPTATPARSAAAVDLGGLARTSVRARSRSVLGTLPASERAASSRCDREATAAGSRAACQVVARGRPGTPPRGSAAPRSPARTRGPRCRRRPRRSRHLARDSARTITRSARTRSDLRCANDSRRSSSALARRQRSMRPSGGCARARARSSRSRDAPRGTRAAGELAGNSASSSRTDPGAACARDPALRATERPDGGRAPRRPLAVAREHRGRGVARPRRPRSARRGPARASALSIARATRPARSRTR